MGATLALAMAATTPSQMAGFVAINGDLPVTALERALLSPVPAFLLSCTDRAIQYLKAANRATMVKESPEETLYFNKNNPLQQVVFRQKAEAISASLVEEAWNTLFSQVHRTNSGFYGDCEPRDHLDDHFIYYIDDTSLDGAPHTCKNRHPSPICTRFEHHFHALKPHLHRRSFSDTLPENQRHLIALKRHPLWHMQKLCQLSQPAELRSTFFRNRNAVLCQDVLQLSNPLALSLEFFLSCVKVFHRLTLHLVVAGPFQF